MFYVPKKNRRFNVFKRVNVLQVRDIYNRIGERLPQGSIKGAVAIFNTSKIDQLSIGELYADMELDNSVNNSQVVVDNSTKSDKTDEGASATSEE